MSAPRHSAGGPYEALRDLRKTLEDHGDDPMVAAAAEAAMQAILDSLSEEARAWFERRFMANLAAVEELGPAATTQQIVDKARELSARLS